MEWQIKINNDDQYLEIVTSGIADHEGSMTMAKAIPEAMGKNQLKKILIDHRNISGVVGGITELYQRSHDFAQMGVIHSIRVAEIVRPEHEDFFQFFETVSVNRGYLFKIFRNREDALAWLLR